MKTKYLDAPKIWAGNRGVVKNTFRPWNARLPSIQLPKIPPYQLLTTQWSFKTKYSYIESLLYWSSNQNEDYEGFAIAWRIYFCEHICKRIYLQNMPWKVWTPVLWFSIGSICKKTLYLKSMASVKLNNHCILTLSCEKVLLPYLTLKNTKVVKKQAKKISEVTVYFLDG